MSGSSQWTSTEILLSDNSQGTIRRFSTSVAGEFRFADDWTVTAGVGVSAEADFLVLGERYDFSPGPLGVIGLSYRLVAGEGWTPFVMFSGAASFSTSKTLGLRTLEEARFTAIDARAALTVGEVFANTFAPYASLRGFGGPVIWERNQIELSGSDKYHYAVALGALVTAGWMDAFFEIVPIGERSLNTGVAFTF